MRRLWSIGRRAWLFLSIFLILVFAKAGLAKFDASSGWARAFRTWGYPVWFRVLIGGLELAAAACLIWPRTAAYGAAIIIVVMLGGMGTHAVIEHRPSRATNELGQVVFAGIVLAGRWRRRISLTHSALVSAKDTQGIDTTRAKGRSGDGSD